MMPSSRHAPARLRLLGLVLLASALPDASRSLSAQPIEPFAGFGFGAAWDPEDGWIAVQLNAGARAGVSTAQVRATALGQLLNPSQRWDVAALGGATFSGPVGMVHVAAGPSLTGGLDKSSCFLSSFCSDDRGRTLPVRLGVGLAAEAYVRFIGESFVGVRASANVSGPRTTRGVTIGARHGF